MEYFIGTKSKETYEKYYEKLNDWHLNILDEYDIDKIKKLITSCKNTIIIAKESEYRPLLHLIEKGDIKRSELELFLFKLSYYLAKIRNLKIEIGWHVVSFNEGYKDVKTLRKDFSHIHKYIGANKEIKGFYTLIHRKYKYLLQGSTSDLMIIKSMKQAKYIKAYIELLCLAEEVNKLWQLNISIFRLQNVFFNPENILANLENIVEELQKILNLYIIYNKSILRLLKRSTCFQTLNPYNEATYDKINDVICYIYYFNQYLIQKNF